MVTKYERQLADIRLWDDQVELLIGRKVFGHISQPTGTQWRVTFADGHVCLSMDEAHDYMYSLLRTAQEDPKKLPWPLCEPV
jgi:hypothetical protein